MKKLTTAALVCAFLSACSSVTLQPEQTAKIVSEPSYEQTKKFYFWGVKGEHRVDVAKVCDQQQVLQMQTQRTFENGFFTIITLGIYSPHTVKVWCQSTAENTLVEGS